ncbi:hypothetical protein BDFB_009069, partial [Asbolus verrucosus]
PCFQNGVKLENEERFYFVETGSIDEKKTTDIPKKKTPKVVEDVRGLMEAVPSNSIRKLSQQIHLSYGISHTILKKDLEMFSSKVQVYHKILLRDFALRINYFLHNINDDVLDITFFTDEAWFPLEGYVNSKDGRQKIRMCY